MVLAGQVLTANQGLQTPITLGLGVSHESMLNDLGMSRTRPVRHMSEYLSVLMPLLQTGRVEFAGELYACRGRVFMQPAKPTPVVIAALGPQMLRVAGAMADGTTLSWVGPRTIKSHIKPVLQAAAESAGKSLPRIIATVPVCVTDDRVAARRKVARWVASYADLPSYQAMMAREGVTEVAELCVIGAESEVRDELAQYARAGVTDLAAVELRVDDNSADRTRALLMDIQSAAP